MTTIYIVTAELFDGDCMYFDMVKAFYEKDKAEEFVTRCTEEVNRIRKEVEAHIDKYREELL